MNDQEFLNQAVQNAIDENEKKIVLLQYQYAIFATVHAFEPCEQCRTIDLTLLHKRAEKLLVTTERYQATVSVLPMDRVMDLMNVSQTLFLDIAQLCQDCQARITEQILATFRQNTATR